MSEIFSEPKFIKANLERVAIVCVGGSALRKQGAKNVVMTARNYFINSINLDTFFSIVDSENTFINFLDFHTKKLVEELPDNAKNWGTARKALNLFFREVVYNKFISDQYRLSKSIEQFNRKIKFLEIPLDKYVGDALFNTNNDLPKWKSIKNLSEGVSKKYQDQAKHIAESMETARIHLDLKFWIEAKRRN